MRNETDTAILRYFGGKWRLAPWIVGYFPRHRVYVEPFGGGGSVLFQKERSYSEVYNDLDGQVVNLFRLLRDPATAAQLEAAVRNTPYARAEFELSYQSSDDPIESARRLLIRSHGGFGAACCNPANKTGFRNNATRRGTTPAGDWSSLPRQISAFTERLRDVTIENRPALDVIGSQDTPETLFYVDPPYLPQTRGGSEARAKHPYVHEMNSEQHEDLLARLSSVQGMAIVSGYDHPLYARGLAGWTRVSTKTFADGAQARTESLWLSPRTVAAKADLFAHI